MTAMRSFHRWLIWSSFLIVFIFSSPVQAATTVPPRDRVLILVSLDGFRWDYLQKFHPPNLNKLAAEGVRAERLIPAFPSVTFPNHYTIVTGLWPEHHGIVGNNFYDPAFKTNYNAFNSSSLASRWWGGEPIWVTAIKQGRTADCMFWPGSGAEIQGIRPTQWKPFDKKLETTNCVDIVLDWLAQTNQKPSLITLYFHQTDTAGHHNGPDSPEMVKAVKQVDDAIGWLMDGIHRLKLNDKANIIVVSDHGMTEISTNRVIALSDFVDMDKVQVDFSGAVAGLRPLEGNTNDLYASFAGKENHFHVYRRENTPERFHFRNNDRIPPVILVADEGWYLRKAPLTEKTAASFEKATHGYDPKTLSMGATFIARGPAFRHGVVIPPVENIHIYNLLCATIGLTPAANDGDDRLVKEVLAK
ncbi:MAG: ectonucleotide pyrophosphatase/phosphodiesterase [Limisphaerales bacterium]